MWSDDASRVDMLAYEPYADLIAEISVSGRMNPLTIGLFGNWGSGKSTLLRLIENTLQKHANSKIVVVTVNAWMFEGYDDAKTALMEAILRNLQENSTFFEKCSNKIQSLIKRIDWIRVGSTAVKKGIPFAVSLMTGNPLPAILGSLNWDKLTSEKGVTQDLETLKTLKEEYLKEDKEDNVIQNIRKFREEFSEVILDSGIDNLIIMIDDLDRCNPDRIVESLEAIKLFLAVDKTTFIIAMDEDVITYSIKRKYPQMDDVDLDISKDYIEKIVQLPIKIAELTESDIKNYMLLLVCELYLQNESLSLLIQALRDKDIFVRGEIVSGKEIVQIVGEQGGDMLKQGFDKIDFETQLNIFNSIGDIIATTLKGNPRQTKRFLNTFYIRKRLAEIQKIQLNPSILAKLMVLEYVDRDLFRELYKWQVEHSGYPLPLRDIELVVLSGSLSESSERTSLKENHRGWQSETIKRWIGVEPTNLSEHDLSPYFYLARESITDKKLFSINLNQEERKLINQICNTSVSEIIRIKKIQELESLSEVSRNEVVKGLISKYNHDMKNNLWVLVQVHKLYPQYQPIILEELKKIKKSDFSPAVVIEFSQLDANTMRQLRDYYIERQISTEKLWDSVGGK